MIYTQANIIATSQKGGVMAPYLAFQAERDALCDTTTWTCNLGADYDTTAEQICDTHGGVKIYEDVEICETFLNLLQVDTGGIIPLFRNVPVCIAPSPHCAEGTTHLDLISSMHVCAPLPTLSNSTRRLEEVGPPPADADWDGMPPGWNSN